MCSSVAASPCQTMKLNKQSEWKNKFSSLSCNLRHSLEGGNAALNPSKPLFAVPPKVATTQWPFPSEKTKI
nr:hypothetical transcript [Hymenolepis microstoma]